MDEFFNFEYLSIIFPLFILNIIVNLLTRKIFHYSSEVLFLFKAFKNKTLSRSNTNFTILFHLDYFYICFYYWTASSHSSTLSTFLFNSSFSYLSPLIIELISFSFIPLFFFLFSY